MCQGHIFQKTQFQWVSDPSKKWHLLKEPPQYHIIEDTEVEAMASNMASNIKSCLILFIFASSAGGGNLYSKVEMMLVQENKRVIFFQQSMYAHTLERVSKGKFGKRVYFSTLEFVIHV